MIITCVQCNAALGYVVKRPDGLEYLEISGVYLLAAHGVCKACGCEFHWSVSNLKFAQLIQKLLELREIGDKI